MLFEYCPTCSGSLDTGWECNDCGRDWRPWAYPRYERIKDKLIRKLKLITNTT